MMPCIIWSRQQLRSFNNLPNNLKLNRGGYLKTKEVIHTEATIVQVTQEAIVSMCQNGVYYYLFWKGNESGYKSLRPGNLVRVYYAPGFTPEVYTLEAIGNETDAD